MSKYVIRDATFDDIDKGLADVFIEGYRYHQKGRPDIFTTTSDEEIKKQLIEGMEELHYIVILDDDRIVGYLAYTFKGKHNKLYVNELIITEKYRGKGLGKLLMDEVKKIANDNGCNLIELDCWLFNENAIAMYEHIGYKKQRIKFEMKL